MHKFFIFFILFTFFEAQFALGDDGIKSIPSYNRNFPGARIEIQTSTGWADGMTRVELRYFNADNVQLGYMDYRFKAETLVIEDTSIKKAFRRQGIYGELTRTMLVNEKPQFVTGTWAETNLSEFEAAYNALIESGKSAEEAALTAGAATPRSKVMAHNNYQLVSVDYRPGKVPHFRYRSNSVLTPPLPTTVRSKINELKNTRLNARQVKYLSQRLGWNLLVGAVLTNEQILELIQHIISESAGAENIENIATLLELTFPMLKFMSFTWSLDSNGILKVNNALLSDLKETLSELGIDIDGIQLIDQETVNGLSTAATVFTPQVNPDDPIIHGFGVILGLTDFPVSEPEPASSNSNSLCCVCNRYESWDDRDGDDKICGGHNLSNGAADVRWLSSQDEECENHDGEKVARAGLLCIIEGAPHGQTYYSYRGCERTSSKSSCDSWLERSRKDQTRLDGKEEPRGTKAKAKISLMSAARSFLAAINSAGPLVYANRLSVGSWEVFYLYGLTSEKIASGDKVYLRAKSGAYLSADGDSKSAVTATHLQPSESTTFHIVKLEGTFGSPVLAPVGKAIHSGDWVAFRAQNGDYLASTTDTKRAILDRFSSSLWKAWRIDSLTPQQGNSSTSMTPNVTADFKD